MQKEILKPNFREHSTTEAYIGFDDFISFGPGCVIIIRPMGHSERINTKFNR
jgi:hypothetical protein